MLSAINAKGMPCMAHETEKNEGPFMCKECGEYVILKKGRQVIHHFSHNR